MGTKTLEPPTSLLPSTPTLLFPDPEQCHQPVPVAATHLQLTTGNLRGLSAALKNLNVAGQTPRASPSPSDSSSDSESNHRIHISTKRVCIREDMNTTREISPRPPRPTAIVITDPSATPESKWTKPDTPAPWHTTVRRGVHEVNENEAKLKKRKRAVIQLEKPVPCTPVKRNGNASSRVTIKRLAAATPQGRFFGSRRGNGIGIRRRSHFALPRPQSLATICRILSTRNALSTPTAPESGSLSRTYLYPGDSNDGGVDVRSTVQSQYPASVELAPRYTTSGLATGMFDTLADDLNYLPSDPIQPAPAANSLLSDRLRQPRTYVDHVRSQRQPPNARQSTAAIVEAHEKDKVEVTRQRRSSL